MLYFGLASPEQGRATADRLGRDFLRSGGVRSYGRPGLADTARARWLALNRRTYAATGKMTEKYDVVDAARPAGPACAAGRRG